MKYIEAIELEKRANCNEAIAVALRTTPDKEPPPDLESTVQCKEKIRQNEMPDRCYLVNGSNCPKGRK